jgi:hypothetical protein
LSCCRKTTPGRYGWLGTVGYYDISLSRCQENTATASRYARLQYTLDGSAFTDAGVIAIYENGSYTNITAAVTIRFATVSVLGNAWLAKTVNAQ